MSDACCSALGSDALSNWRALFESFNMAQDKLHELVRSPHLASVPSNKAELDVNGFGSFCRHKRASAAGPNPGITKYNNNSNIRKLT